jgi:hypothetical protein
MQNKRFDQSGQVQQVKQNGGHRQEQNRHLQTKQVIIK